MSIEEYFKPRFGERRRRLLELVFNEGLGPTAAARQLGLSVKCARNWIQEVVERGAINPTKRHIRQARQPKTEHSERVTLGDAFHRRLRYQWDSESTLKELAERFNVCTYTIRYHAKKLGLPPRGRRIDDNKLKELWADPTLTLWVIGAKLGGFDKSTVRARGKKLGLPRRPRRKAAADHPFRARVVTHRG